MVGNQQKSRMRWMALALTLIVGIVAGCSGSQPSGGGKNTPLKLTLGHIFAPDTLTGKGGDKFVELVKQKSGGQIEIIYKPGAALGDERAHIEQVTTGTIDLTVTGDGMIAANAPDYAVMTMPFVFRDAAHAMKVRDGSVGKRMNQDMVSKTGVRIMGWMNIGPRQLSSNKPVRTLADLKGQKLRLPDVKWWIKAWEKTDVAVATVAFNELYLALQTGTVDAQENPADFIKGQKFYEVQKYLIQTNHVQNIQGWYMNESRYKALTADQRKWIEESVTEASEWVNQQAKAADEAALKFLTSDGKMELIKPDFSGLAERLKTLPGEVGGPAAQKLFEEIQAVK